MFSSARAFRSAPSLVCRRARRATLVVFALGLCRCSGSFEPSGPGQDAGGSVSDAAPIVVIPAPDARDARGTDGEAMTPDATQTDATQTDATQTDATQTDATQTDATQTDAAQLCDPSPDPRDEPCLISDTYGVFVAAPRIADAGSGAALDASSGVAIDGGAAVGSMANPAATIGQGLELAMANSKSRVYVCNGKYAESVSVTVAVGVYGGFSCSMGPSGPAWRWVGGVAEVTAPSVTNPPAPVYALAIDAPGSAPITIEDMSFAAPDAFGTDPKGNGASSVAAFVNASKATFSRCLLTAGNGARGANGGAPPSNYAADAPAGGIGTAVGSITCNYRADGITPDSSSGGAGGVVTVLTRTQPAPGSPGTSVPPPVFLAAGAVPAHDGAGGMPSLGASSADEGNSGDPGADGVSRPAGRPPSGAGQLSSAGWSPSRGGAGAAGQPGQGGGGTGAFNLCVSGAGGSGGCGGAGGLSAGGGGASVALMSVGSAVTLHASALISGQGGNGGEGSAGQAGQSGGAGYLVLCAIGFGLVPSAQGGAGGNGAGGSGGAGGTGGISVGILYTGGSVPSFNTSDTSIAFGAAGSAGMGGLGGQPGGTEGNPGNPGSAGYVGPHASSPYLQAP